MAVIACLALAPAQAAETKDASPTGATSKAENGIAASPSAGAKAKKARPPKTSAAARKKPQAVPTIERLAIPRAIDGAGTASAGSSLAPLPRGGIPSDDATNRRNSLSFGGPGEGSWMAPVIREEKPLDPTRDSGTFRDTTFGLQLHAPF